MDVALTANCGRISENPCDGFHRHADVLLRLPFGDGFVELSQGDCGKDRPCPSAEVLRRELLTRDLAEIFVYVLRGNVAGFAGFVDVCKQFLTRQILATPNNARELAILQCDLVRFAALALERE